MKTPKLAGVCGVLAGMCLGSPAQAVVISTGTSDSLYTNLANTAAYSSVGQIYGTDTTGGFAASGVLIAPDWVLTAGHVTSGATSLEFFLDSGGSWSSFASRTGVYADQWYTYPKWTGSLGAGYDLGLIHLSGSVTCGYADCTAERYLGTGELGQLGTMVGFGMTGTGSTGALTFDGLKRAGTNMVDAVYSTPGRTNRILLADFDSGLAADNSMGSSDPTSLEALIAPGDSGGGLFENIGGIDYLVGITSFGWGRLDADPDSDYGDVGGWTRLTYFNSWIDSIMAGGTPTHGGGKKGSGTELQAAAVAVPEPASLALLAIGLAALAFRRAARTLS